MKSLTIVTSCTRYGHFLPAWGESIVHQTVKPGRVVILTHGTEPDRAAGEAVAGMLKAHKIDVHHEHSAVRLDLGVARNRAVSLANTEWVMHLDTDDRLMPHAVHDIECFAPSCDVVSLGYERSGQRENRPKNQRRLYKDGNGVEMLTHIAPASGVSPFKKSLWERSPYREDMRGAWDTALWIGFARLGARFRATKRPCFWYWHHPDSVFTKRRTTFDWTHAITVSQLKMLRRDDRGVSVIVPMDTKPDIYRKNAWMAMRAHYAHHFPSWQIVEGINKNPRWNKGAAVTDALTRATGDILVIADSDCYVDPKVLQEMVDAVADGTAWAMPHSKVHRLSTEKTPEYLRAIEKFETLTGPTATDLCRPVYEGYIGGGIIVVRRVYYEAVGGFPAAFVGWGGEDEALGTILNTMVGPVLRGNADLIHLWHPYQASRQFPSRNANLCRAIKGAAMISPEKLWEMVSRLPGAPHTLEQVRQAKPVPSVKRVGLRR